MNNKIVNLINMLREIDLERNSIRDIRMILNFIAKELEEELNKKGE